MAIRQSSLRASSATLLCISAAVAANGCSTLPNGREWGQDATVKPGWQRVRQAATDAAESPRFWGPLLGAAAFQINGWDRKVSHWARAHTPVFGSQRSASDWSDRLRSASSAAYLATALATPSGEDPQGWTLDKARGLLVGFAAVGVTDWESALLKREAARERPNGQDTQSMPSSHASRSAVFTELAQRNVSSLAIDDNARRALDFGLDALTYGTSWARVEAGFHYPSDTLVGMALGSFTGALFNDAFLGLERTGRLAFEVDPLPRGAELRVYLDL